MLQMKYQYYEKVGENNTCQSTNEEFAHLPLNGRQQILVHKIKEFLYNCSQS